MAPNLHPEYQRTINENKNAFNRKSGMGAVFLDNGKDAVSRTSNQLLEKSRISGSMIPAGGAGCSS